MKYLLSSLFYGIIFWSCNSEQKDDSSKKREYYQQNKAALHEIVEIYDSTTKKLPYTIRINYLTFSNEVYLTVNFGDSSFIFEYEKDVWHTKKFLVNGQIDKKEFNRLLHLMKSLKLIEIYKLEFNWDKESQRNLSYTIALVNKEKSNLIPRINASNSVLYGYEFIINDVDSSSTKWKERIEVDDNVILYKANSEP